MKIAVISDIHGNFPALQSVVDDALSNNVDKFILIGDYIFDLPFTNEVIKLIMELKNAHIIKGNKETYLRGMKKSNDWVCKQMAGMYHIFLGLTPEIYDYINGLDETLHLQISQRLNIYATHIPKFQEDSTKTNCGSSQFHKKMLSKPFTHEHFLREFHDFINSEECTAYINTIDADVILYGHNHLQCYGYCGNKLILNPGSCGQPLDFNNNASYSIIEETSNGLIVVEKRVKYDVDSTISQFKQSQLYKEGKIWSDLIILALQTGKDYFGFFFEIANNIKLEKNETGHFYSDSTWETANEVFSAILMDEKKCSFRSACDCLKPKTLN